jgi:O-antigen ligase
VVKISNVRTGAGKSNSDIGLWFLPILFTIPAMSAYFHSIAPNENVFKGQDWGIWVAFALFVSAVISWLFSQASVPLSPLARVALLFMFTAWLYQVVRIQLDGSLFNLTAFVVPFALIMVSVKPPTFKAVWFSGLTLGYSLIAVSVASILFGVLGFGPDGFDVTDSGGSRIPLLGELLGIETRWGGPFGSVNYAAPIGGLLVVLAFNYNKANRYVFLSSGIVILTLSQARSTVFAVGVALVILALWSAPISRIKNGISLRVIVLVGLAVAYFAYVFFFDRSLNGRATIWVDFGDLWLQSPWFGVGDSGIIDFVNSRDSDPSFVPHQHAHSVLFDELVRFGVPMLFLSVGTFVSALLLSLRSASIDFGRNLAIVVFVLLAGLTETIHSFSYMTAYMCVLLFVVLSSNSGRRQQV